MDLVSREHALELDRTDPLARFRERFEIADPDLIYFDGNSLGRLPKSVVARIADVVEKEWGDSLIRGWNKGWWEAPRRIGDRIASLLGASSGEIAVSDQTTLNLFKLTLAALELRPNRSKILTDTLNFPSDLYVLQGIGRLLGGRHEIIRIPSADDGIMPNLAAMTAALDDRVALVTLSHVAFKSGFLYEMKAVTDAAHRNGALVLWDLSHSAGVVPVDLDACGVDMAVGCTYKYLNGGPGAPAFLYVNAGLQARARSPIWGWWSQANPFAFELDYRPAPGIQRFLTGTAPVLSMLALDAALQSVLDAGIVPIRKKSVALTELAIQLVDASLAPIGFSLGTPRDPERRGSHVSIRQPDGYRISRALIDEMKLIPDFRQPDNIRLGFAPLYTSFVDVWDGIDRVRRTVVERRFEKYPHERLDVP